MGVEDVDATVARVTEAGGTVLMEPIDVLDAGRMDVVSDPVGATFSLWQPGAHIGSQAFDEPGAFCWTELRSRDIETARRFYRTVVGWEGEPSGPDLCTAFVLDDDIRVGRALGDSSLTTAAGCPDIAARLRSGIRDTR